MKRGRHDGERRVIDQRVRGTELGELNTPLDIAGPSIEIVGEERDRSGEETGHQKDAGDASFHPEHRAQKKRGGETDEAEGGAPAERKIRLDTDKRRECQ